MTRLAFRILFLLVILNSCRNTSPIPQKVADVIEQSGTNKKELEKSIQYFQKSGDTLKLEACYFLIENMKGHYSYDTRDNAYFDKYYNIFKNVPRDNKDDIIDSLRQLGIKARPYTETLSDIKHITAQYLIDNINLAFEAWDKTPWKESYSFREFCEYVLPYRAIDKVPLENWRRFLNEDFQDMFDSLRKEKRKELAYSAIFKKTKEDFFITTKNLFPSPVSIKNCNIAKVGSCFDNCDYTASAARAFGVPVVTDFTPVWGNFRMGHEWNSMILPDNTIITHLRLEHVPKKYPGMVHAMRDFDLNTHALLYTRDELGDNKLLKEIVESGNFDSHAVNAEYIPKEYQIFRQKNVSKAFRNMYSFQDSSLGAIENDKSIIPDFFNNTHLKDVTDSYFNGLNISVNLDSATSDKYVFLCLFSKKGFVPVAWCHNNKNKSASFNDVGADILYFTMYYRLGKFVPASKPFVLQPDGSLSYIRPNLEKREQVKLLRKFPLTLRFIYYANFMLHGKFEASNDSLFNTKVELFKITKTPLTWNEVSIKKPGKYRYVRYINDSSHGDIGEFEIYSNQSGKPIKTNGKIISSTTPFNYSPSFAFDNNLTTFARSASPGGWIGVDFGHKIQIDKIRFYPRFDSNEIIPGQNFELKYWDNGWKSLGNKTAKAPYLIYDSVPENCLLWLINNSGGNEERPFFYKGGMQIWR